MEFHLCLHLNKIAGKGCQPCLENFIKKELKGWQPFATLLNYKHYNKTYRNQF
jgi:hypothetical protein